MSSSGNNAGRRRPPRLAIWVLKSLGFIRRNPALIGDLLEEFRSGRSTAWYWRQTANLIFTWIRRNGIHDLPGVAMVFALLAGIDFMFWRFGRPAPIPHWTALILETVLLAVFFWIRTWWRERRRLGGVLQFAFLVLWWAYVAWTNRDPLWDWLSQDLLIAAGVWVWGMVCEMKKSRARRS